MNELIASGSVSVKELAGQYAVSEETIRQDLTRMEDMGLCARIHGGATLAPYREVSTDIKTNERAREKNAIAKRAVEEIHDGMTVWIGSGSTLTALARYLPLRRDLTIITNNLDFASATKNTRHEIIFIGGRVQKRGACTVGAFALENLSQVRIDLAFMGCDGFSLREGPTTFSFEETEIKRFILHHAEKRILLCDASKFALTGSFIFARYEDFESIITDQPLPKDAAEAAASVRMILVQQEP